MRRWLSMVVDAYATTLLDRNPMDIEHIRYAYEQGVGEIDLEKLNIGEISI